MKLEQIRKDMASGKAIEDIIEEFDWREFEEVVADILTDNNFRIRQNFRFKTKRRYEIDVLAIRDNVVLCIDCKQWGRGRYKRTGLLHSVEEQEERVKELRKFLKTNPIVQSLLKIKIQRIHPIIVTWLQEDLIKEKDTFVVPVWKLNSFLVELENYLNTFRKPYEEDI